MQSEGVRSVLLQPRMQKNEATNMCFHRVEEPNHIPGGGGVSVKYEVTDRNVTSTSNVVIRAERSITNHARNKMRLC